MADSVFREYSQADAVRSDRSAGDRARHREKVREAIRENIAEVIAEEAIIGRSGDRVVKVPIRGIREYRFVFGENEPRVGTGDGDTEEGDVVGRAGEGGAAAGPGPAGDQPGTDYYETEISLEELTEIMFEDLALPEMERKRLREIPAERERKRKGYRQTGVRVQLDKRRTARARIRRKLARGRAEGEEGAHDGVAGPTADGGTQPRGETPDGIDGGGDRGPGETRRFPFHRDDLTYRRTVRDEVLQSNAVVLCIMDTSGSMDTMKKYLARSFFFLLHRFVLTRYRNVEVAFVAHHARAREVSEEEFFHKGESGGTLISSGYRKALEIIGERYPPELWNVYAFHCSDGDNWTSDNEAALEATREICRVANLFGYGEIKPLNSRRYGSSMLEVFGTLDEPNFHTVKIERREDVWPGFRELLQREQTPERGG
jgi:uncharacterized protein